MGTKALAVLCWLAISGASGKVINVSVVKDNVGAEGGAAPRLYRDAPLAVYASAAPYGAFSFHVPFAVPAKSSPYIPVKQESVAIQNSNGFLKDSYGNKFVEPSQSFTYKTTFPQEFVQLQHLPAHLSQPLTTSPSYLLPQSPPRAFFGGQYRLPSFDSVTSPFIRYGVAQPFFGPVKSLTPASDQQFQFVTPATVLQESGNNHVHNQVQHEPKSQQLNDKPAAYNIEHYGPPRQPQVAPSTQEKVTTPIKHTLKTVHNGHETVVQVETKPPLPLLDLSLLEPLKFDNPVVPQIQHFLPRISEATYYKLPELADVDEVKKHMNEFIVQKTKSYDSGVIKGKPCGKVCSGDTKKKQKKPPKKDTDVYVHYEHKSENPDIKVKGKPNDPDNSYEINSPNYKETYNEQVVSYNKETQSDPISYTYQTENQKQPVTYSFSHSSKDPGQTKTIHYVNKEPVPNHLIYNFQPTVKSVEHKETSHPSPESEDSSESSEVNDESPSYDHSQYDTQNDESPYSHHSSPASYYHESTPSSYHQSSYSKPSHQHGKSPQSHNSNPASYSHQSIPSTYHQSHSSHSEPSSDSHQSTPSTYHQSHSSHSEPSSNSHQSTPSTYHQSHSSHSEPSSNSHQSTPSSYHQSHSSHSEPSSDSHQSTPSTYHQSHSSHSEPSSNSHSSKDSRPSSQSRPSSHSHHSIQTNPSTQSHPSTYSHHSTHSHTSTHSHPSTRSHPSTQSHSSANSHPTTQSHPGSSSHYSAHPAPSHSQQSHPQHLKAAQNGQAYRNPNQVHYSVNPKTAPKYTIKPLRSGMHLQPVQEFIENLRFLPSYASAAIRVDPNQHVAPKQQEKHSPQHHVQQTTPRARSEGHVSSEPVIYEKSKQIIIQEESPEEVHSHQEKLTAQSVGQEENSEENFEKSYKEAAYGFPSYGKATQSEEDIYNPDSYGEPQNSEEDTKNLPFEKYQEEEDEFPKFSYLGYKDARDKMKENYYLDYSIAKPESMTDRHQSKINYYKMFLKHKPEKTFGHSNGDKEKQKYTVEPLFFDSTEKSKSAAYKSAPLYEYDFSKDSRDSAAHASRPGLRFRAKTHFVEPQFQYGFEPIAIPRLDSELDSMASNISPESEKPGGMRKKLYKENWYIKKTTTSGKPS